MRVPDLEAMIDAEEQQALPETRLVNALRGYRYRSIGDGTLLELCRDAWGRPTDRPVDFRGVPYATRGAPTDEGYRVYHAVVSILAGEYPGLCSWHVLDVVDALTAYMESQRASA
jgi:hypothetical protein